MMRGGCLCGAIRIALREPPGAVVYCHCSQCRKTAGAAFNAVIPVAAGAFDLADPQGMLRAFFSSPGKARHFCGRCGAQIYSQRDGSDTVRVRAGIVEDLADVRHAGHIYVAASAPWFETPDDLPRYDALEPGQDTRRGSR